MCTYSSILYRIQRPCFSWVKILGIFLVLFTMSCKDYKKQDAADILNTQEPHIFENESADKIKGGLLATDFTSLDDLKQVVNIEYFNVDHRNSDFIHGRPYVTLTHQTKGRSVKSILHAGLSETEIKQARDGSLFKKMELAFQSPYFVINRNDLLRVYILARRRDKNFGAGDIAFYDLAETMLYHIVEDDLMHLSSLELSEKGYLNTFNHINAQTFMTILFSERLADFIADIHELGNLPELVSGAFTAAQIMDLEKGPVDNYVDIVNNEWGQELGKLLKEKYKINKKTVWTTDLLATVLNEIQQYYSWVFQIGFKPFKPSDDLVKRFSSKINQVMKDVSGLK